MRTTFTISDDLYKALKKISADKSISYKELVDRVLRVGIAQLNQAESAEEDYEMETVRLGTPSIQVDDIAEVLAVLEGDSHR